MKCCGCSKVIAEGEPSQRYTLTVAVDVGREQWGRAVELDLCEACPDSALAKTIERVRAMIAEIEA